MANKFPEVFIIGSPKCGTTTLSYYLNKHPNVSVSKPKETRFFSKDELYNKGLEFYRKYYFYNAPDENIWIDATPGYLHLGAEVIPRLKDVYKNNNPKFIIIMRNPTERAWSHYLHRKRIALEERSFKDCIEGEIKYSRHISKHNIGYYQIGLYAEHISYWLKYFPIDNFLFLTTDELKSDPKKCLNNCFHFFDLENEYINVNDNKNIASEPKSRMLMKIINQDSLIKGALKKMFSPYYRSIIMHSLRKSLLQPVPKGNNKTFPESIKKILYDKYNNDIIKLEKLVGKNLAHWLTNQ